LSIQSFERCGITLLCEPDCLSFWHLARYRLHSWSHSQAPENLESARLGGALISYNRSEYPIYSAKK
jgi:hypothetical protein